MPADQASSCPATPLPPWTAPEAVAMVLESSALSVHDALDQLMRHPAISDLGDEAIGTLWTVLAEVLNNVVKHAYAEYPGTICLRLWRDGDALAVEVTDHGLPMPGLSLPEGNLPAPERPGELPEGNFGWFLIRTLTDYLAYERLDDTNRLTFSIAAC